MATSRPVSTPGLMATLQPQGRHLLAQTIIRPWSVVLAVLVLLLTFSPVRAAEPDLYKSELTGWTIAVYGENYVIDSSALEEYPHGRGERVYIASLESRGFGEISFFDDTDTPQDTIELMFTDFEAASEEFEVVTSGDDGGIWYGLAHFVVADKTGYFYVEVAQDVEGNVDLLQSFYSLDADFLQELDLIRADVSIDNNMFLGQNVIDLDEEVTADSAARAERQATPVVDEMSFDTWVATLSVQAPLVMTNHVTNNDLEGMYFTTESTSGTGIIAFLHQDLKTAEDVITLIVTDVPIGEVHPDEVYHAADAGVDRDVAAYLVQGEAGEVLMIVAVTNVDDGVWLIESFAAPQDTMAAEFATVQDGVRLDGTPVFQDVDIETILAQTENE